MITRNNHLSFHQQSCSTLHAHLEIWKAAASCGECSSSSASQNQDFSNQIQWSPTMHSSGSSTGDLSDGKNPRSITSQVPPLFDAFYLTVWQVPQVWRVAPIQSQARKKRTNLINLITDIPLHPTDTKFDSLPMAYNNGPTSASTLHIFQFSHNNIPFKANYSNVCVV